MKIKFPIAYVTKIEMVLLFVIIDLRAAAQTPPARHDVNTSIREEEQTSQSSTPHREFKLSGKINCKKSSLATMGISRRQYSTQFDEIIEVLIYLACIKYFKIIKTNLSLKMFGRYLFSYFNKQLRPVMKMLRVLLFDLTVHIVWQKKI